MTEIQEILQECVEKIQGHSRTGQQVMVDTVAAALNKNTPLLLEAGTGTGKSLGYLVPAINETYNGKKCVVSTATLALQNQIFTKDIPLVCEVFKERKQYSPTVAILKGWSNYLCLHKLNGGFAEEEYLFDDETLDKTSNFSENPQIKLQEENKNQTDNNTDEASIDNINYIFGLEKTSSTVTNGTQIIDPFSSNQTLTNSVEETQNETFETQDDETQTPNISLSDRAKATLRIREWATKTTTGDRDELKPGVDQKIWQQVSLSPSECLNKNCPMFNECFPMKARQKAHDADLIVTNHSILGIEINSQTPILPTYDTLIVDEAHDLENRVISQATFTLNMPLLGSLTQRLKKQTIVDEILDKELSRFNGEMLKIQEGWMQDGFSEELRDVVEKIHAALIKAAVKLQEQETAAGKEISKLEKIYVAKGQLQETLEILDAMLAYSSKHNVMWSTRSYDDKHININMAPLQVSGGIYNCLINERSSVFTSATLTIGKSFNRMAKVLGVSQNHDAVSVQSPFDYSKQGILYVANDLPSPGKNGIHEQACERLKALLEASNGGALCLFSSMFATQTAAEYIREKTDLDILVQGEEQLPNLIESFRTNKNSCLFGTLSLWQGIDVSGDASRLVVIDRIPFARPNDPLHQAQCSLVEEQGGNSFMSVTLPKAALLLSQGAGRLIRRIDDKGVLAVLDSRLGTARYNKILLDSMPDFWRTTDLGIVLNSLNNLSADK